MEIPKKAGIYKLVCIVSGKIYIGKSVNIYNRLSYHKSCCNRKFGRFHFENALIKYGWENFEIDILEIFENFNKNLDKEKLFDREAHYIGIYNSTDRNIGYNICKYSTDRTGYKCSEEVRKRMSEGQRGKKHSEYTKNKMKKPKSDSFKEKCRRRKHTEESKEKMRISKMGKQMSEETKIKIRESKIGKPLSEEHKENARTARLGYKHSEETKQKMREARLNNLKLTLNTFEGENLQTKQTKLENKLKQ
jgi:group I intron endonuclease